MKFYSGLDLSARDCHVCVVDENLNILIDEKVRNELPRIMRWLEPYKPMLETVVESSFNWYWLVDGLADSGFNICLAPTRDLAMITEAKVKTDRRDAFTLAKLLKAGVITQAYIYPKATRPVRDLLRRRARLVGQRATEYGSLRKLLLAHGIFDTSWSELHFAGPEDLERWFQHPIIQMHARLELARIKLYTEQIQSLEQTLLGTVEENAGYQRLLQIPGVGKVLALTILYETGNIGRFADVRRFCSYCRVVPGIAQSGRSNRRGRNSKQGNPYLKWALSQAAVYAVRYYPRVRRAFDRQRERHRGRARKLVTYNIIAHKLAQAVYHGLHGAEYREERLFGH